jgi:HK97 family phage prohead protease
MERRFVSAVELRASQGDEGAMVISGRAASFGTYSEDLNGFRETIKRGAFARSLQSDRDIKCTFNHGDPLLGRKQNGSLSCQEDERGLTFRAILPPTQAARDVYVLVQNRYATDCSFAFSPDSEGDDPGEQWDTYLDDSGERVRRRTLTRVKLFDVSVLSASPAYPSGTSVEVDSKPMMQLNSSRSMADYFPNGVPESFSPELRMQIMRYESRRSGSNRKNLLNFILQ